MFFVAVFHVFALIFILQFASSNDTISINAGGSPNLTISPGNYIEGFFSCIPDTCSSLGYNCGTVTESSCGTSLSCGSCSSGQTCTNNVCVSTSSGGGSSGGGGGGGGGGGVATVTNISVNPGEFNVNLAINTNIQKTITVTNAGTSQLTLSISQNNLDGMVILDKNSVTLAAGESTTIGVTFLATNETGIFTGTINIGSEEVLVSLNVKTKLLLFDSNIVVLNKDYVVPQGNTLNTEVTLIPFGDPERLDVTLNYVIKDYNGKIYLTKKETLLVDKKTTLKRDFDTGILPLGKYIVGLELVYPNGVAPSSAHFEVTKRATFLGSYIFYLIIIMLIILELILIILLWREHKRKSQKQNNSGQVFPRT